MAVVCPFYEIDPDSVESGDRIVLAAFKQHGAEDAPPLCYYADRLPRSIKLYTVLAIVACIFATPLTLLCCIPIITYNAKVSHDTGNFVFFDEGLIGAHLYYFVLYALMIVFFLH